MEDRITCDHDGYKLRVPFKTKSEDTLLVIVCFHPEHKVVNITECSKEEYEEALRC